MLILSPSLHWSMSIQDFLLYFTAIILCTNICLLHLLMCFYYTKINFNFFSSDLRRPAISTGTRGSSPFSTGTHPLKGLSHQSKYFVKSRVADLDLDLDTHGSYYFGKLDLDPQLSEKRTWSGSALKSKFRSCSSSKWSYGGLWTLTVEALRLKMEPCSVCNSVVADSRHFDEEDQDLHWSEMRDSDPP